MGTPFLGVGVKGVNLSNVGKTMPQTTQLRMVSIPPIKIMMAGGSDGIV